MLNGLITAIRTLTILPLPGKEARNLASALFFFPIVGFGLGWLLFEISILFGYDAVGRWPEGTAVLLVALEAFFTRGLHLDGVADWADGFWGARTKSEVLRIMKDPRTGAFGVIALVCVLLAKWVCFTRLVQIGAQRWIVAACVISRTMQVALAAASPYAREEDGTGAAFIRRAGPHHVGAAVFLAVLLLATWFQTAWLWLPALALGWIVSRLFGLWCRMRIGGVTGDLLGACSELVEIAILATGAVAFHA